jgi:hypothetical protein
VSTTQRRPRRLTDQAILDLREGTQLRLLDEANAELEATVLYQLKDHTYAKRGDGHIFKLDRRFRVYLRHRS